MRSDYRFGEQVFSVETRPGPTATAGRLRLQVTVDGRVLDVEVIERANGRLVLTTADGTHTVFVARHDEARLVQLGGAPVVRLDSGRVPRRARSAARTDGEFAAAMHSQIVAIPVKVGDRVARGDVLVVMEAMKMESRITAPYDGTVSAIHCAAGEVVERGRNLLELTPDQG